MSAILFIRHGPTDWNTRRLIQGQSDVPLSPEGRAEVRRWILPDEFQGFEWHASTLARARETALLMGAAGVRLEPRLMEAHWGEWEGKSLAQLQAEIGDPFGAMAAEGLDLLPPGGESPRMVRARLADWLAEIAPAQRPAVAVCHAGVVRAAYSLATGWEMRDKPPLERPHGFAHLYELAPGGALAVLRLNIALAPAEPDAVQERRPGRAHG